MKPYIFINKADNTQSNWCVQVSDDTCWQGYTFDQAKALLVELQGGDAVGGSEKLVQSVLGVLGYVYEGLAFFLCMGALGAFMTMLQIMVEG